MAIQNQESLREYNGHLVANLKDIPRNQGPFESAIASDKLKRWCALGPEVNNDENDDKLTGINNTQD